MHSYRVLTVEDADKWQALFRGASGGLPALKLYPCKDAKAALAQLASVPFHLASVDQNLPAEEGHPPSDDTGIDLLQEIVETHPFVRTTVYTANGRPNFANRAGRLGDTEYFEKKRSEEQRDGLDVIPYFKLLQTMLASGLRDDSDKWETGYVQWALDRGRSHLPPMLAIFADDILRGLGGTEGHFSQGETVGALAKMLERTVELAWAQAAALNAYLHPGATTPVFDDVPAETAHGFEVSLEALFFRLERSLGQWRGYVSSDHNTHVRAGKTFVDAITKLRQARNPVIHGNREFSAVDFSNLTPTWLAFIDGLAFWADYKLMTRVTIHPEHREKLQFAAIAGQKPWRMTSIVSDAKIPQDREGRSTTIFMLYRADKGDRLVNLFPFISMVERAGKAPEPGLLLPAGGGRRFIRRSLETGEEITGVALTERERTSIRRLFGQRWTV